MRTRLQNMFCTVSLFLTNSSHKPRSHSTVICHICLFEKHNVWLYFHDRECTNRLYTDIFLVVVCKKKKEKMYVCKYQFKWIINTNPCIRGSNSLIQTLFYKINKYQCKETHLCQYLCITFSLMSYFKWYTLHLIAKAAQRAFLIASSNPYDV